LIFALLFFHPAGGEGGSLVAKGSGG